MPSIRALPLGLTLLLCAACTGDVSDGRATSRPGADAEGSDTTIGLDRLLERHVTALGGRAALDSIRNVVVVQEIVEPSFTVTGRYRATQDGRMRIDVYAGDQRVFAEGIDGAGAWGWSPDQGTIQPNAEGEAALRHGIEYNLFGLHRFPERGHELELVDRQEVEGVDYYVVRVTLADGFETYLYVHPGSWLVERRRDVRALHPDVDPRELAIETVYEDFQERCGVLRAMRSRQVDRTAGEVLQTSRTLERRCNVAPDELAIPRDDEPGPPSR